MKEIIVLSGPEGFLKVLGLTRQGVVKVVAIALNCQFFDGKRWENTFACDIKGVNLSVCSNAKGAKVILRVKKGESVSYTHLTLPTIYSV